MRSILVLIIALSSLQTSLAQEGAISMYFDLPMGRPSDHFRAEIRLEEEVIKNYRLDEYEVQDTLPTGEYSVSVYGGDTLLFTYFNVKVVSSATSFYYFENPEVDVEWYSGDTLGGMFSAHYSVLWANRGLGGQNTSVSNSWSFGFGGKGTAFYGKYFGIGGSGGVTYEHSWLDLDSTIYPGYARSKERLGYLSVNAGFHIRTSFYDQRIQNASGLYLDLGARYQLPLLFRHHLKNGDMSTRTKKIHRWNDLRLFADLVYNFGSAGLGLTFQYRPFDFVKSPFPETPRFELGISLIPVIGGQR